MTPDDLDRLCTYQGSLGVDDAVIDAMVAIRERFAAIEKRLATVKCNRGTPGCIYGNDVHGICGVRVAQ